MANKTKEKSKQPEELDLKPFMNLMVVLIPMLLLSAEFAKIAVIDIKLPEGRGSQTQKAQKKPPKDDESSKLMLTAIITDSVVTLGAKSGFLPSVYYKEYHRYMGGDGAELTVQYDPENPEPPENPKTGEPFTREQRYEIFLYVTDEDYGDVKKCLYTKFGNMLTDPDGAPVKDVSVGDTVYAVTNPRRQIIVSDPNEYTTQKMSAYDVLKSRLMKIKERYKDAEDKDNIIVAAENEVIYDKIVQIMDAAREADFPHIQIAKMRAS